MNYAALALAGVIALGAAGVAPAGSEAMAAEKVGKFPDWKGKRNREAGTVEVIDETHIRMRGSGRILRMVGIAQLHDVKKARIATEGIGKLLNGKKIDCGWMEDLGARVKEMIVSSDGSPLAACAIREVAYSKCKDRLKCGVQHRIIKAGYGKVERGEWEKRTRGAGKVVVELTTLEAQARKEKRGTWARTE